MNVTIELTPEIIEGIANSEAVKHGYDKLSDCNDDYTEMYKVAFTDGFNLMMNFIETAKSITINNKKPNFCGDCRNAGLVVGSTLYCLKNNMNVDEAGIACGHFESIERSAK